jgi:hypothetical protein
MFMALLTFAPFQNQLWKASGVLRLISSKAGISPGGLYGTAERRAV